MPDSDIPDFFSQLQNELRVQIPGILNRYRSYIPFENEIIALSYNYLEEFSLKGKHLRPTFVWAGWLLAAHNTYSVASYQHDLIQLGAACEFLHTCALIHDDIIDQSPLRRQVPTMYKKWESEHRLRSWHLDPAHYGISMAILLGDLSLSIANSLIMAIDTPTLSPIWTSMQIEVLTGQILDISYAQEKNTQQSTSDIINSLKTSSYTFIRPLQLGATFIGKDDEFLAHLEQLGKSIGAGFQLQDDIIDLFYPSEITGKTQGGDILSGKSTLLISLAITTAKQQGDTASAEYLSQSLGHINDHHHLDDVIKLISNLGIHEQVTEIISSHFFKAQDELIRIRDIYSCSPAAYTAVSNLIDQISQRTQ